MLPDLEIRVLFCYSPEVLTNTYYNLTNLQKDNLGLCNITQGIFRRNITTYNVSVSVANMVQVEVLTQHLVILMGIIYWIKMEE